MAPVSSKRGVAQRIIAAMRPGVAYSSDQLFRETGHRNRDSFVVMLVGLKRNGLVIATGVRGHYRYQLPGPDAKPLPVKKAGPKQIVVSVPFTGNAIECPSYPFKPYRQPAAWDPILDRVRAAREAAPSKGDPL